MFRLWSTRAQQANVVLYNRDGEALEERPLERSDDHVHEASFNDLNDGALYKFRLDDALPLPDPYARFCPLGVHGPAMIWPDTYQWCYPLPARSSTPSPVIYELHIGTFTRDGTYAAAQAKLPYLAELGVDIVELMPLSSFPARADGDMTGWRISRLTLAMAHPTT